MSWGYTYQIAVRMAAPRLGRPSSAAFLERSVGAQPARASDPLRARSGGRRPVVAASKTTLQSTSTSWVRKTASEAHSHQSLVRAACHDCRAVPSATRSWPSSRYRRRPADVGQARLRIAPCSCLCPRSQLRRRRQPLAAGGVLSSSCARGGRLQTTAVLIRESDSVARRAGWVRIQRARERHFRPVRIWR